MLSVFLKITISVSLMRVIKLEDKKKIIIIILEKIMKNWKKSISNSTISLPSPSSPSLLPRGLLQMGVEGGDIDKAGLYSEPYHMTYNSIGGYSSMAHKMSHPNPLSSPDYTGESSCYGLCEPLWEGSNLFKTGFVWASLIRFEPV